MESQELDNQIMRLYMVYINGNACREKSKLALRIANPEGIIDQSHQITGIFYISKNNKNVEMVTSVISPLKF